MSKQNRNKTEQKNKDLDMCIKVKCVRKCLKKIEDTMFLCFLKAGKSDVSGMIARPRITVLYNFIFSAVLNIKHV